MNPKASRAVRLLAATGGFTLWCLAGCHQHKPAHASTTYEQTHKGHHPVAADNPQGWSTYPVVVLVAAKHHIGADTVAQLAQRFDMLFDGIGVDVEANLPEPIISHEEELPPSNRVPNFFRAQQEDFGLSRAEVAAILHDFYVLGGSNRTFPDPTPNQ